MGAHDLDAEGHWKWVEGNLKGNHSSLIYFEINRETSDYY